MKSLLRTLVSLSVVHWLTSIGVVLTTASAVIFLVLVFQPIANPYFGIIVVVVIPALFVLGLLLMPAGLWLASRRGGGYREVLAHLPADGPRITRLAWAFGFATLLNAGIIGLAAHQSVEYMDSKEFCGVTCHSVMQPQYVRYQESAHASVPCVDCHVGSGASSFLQYKLAGVRQLIALSRTTYHRPIGGAMDRMRPASETCETCHSAQRIREDKVKVIRHFNDDETSSEKDTVLLMRVGSKIHNAHIGRGIEYLSLTPDPQTIPAVVVDGKTYAVEGGASAGPMRKMDCMDCHNRAGHDFETAEAAVDRLIAEGRLERSRPFARRDAVAALMGKGPLDKQPAAVRQAHTANVYPSMNISWGTYPSNVGHEKFPGCFRCHDGEHKTKAGESIGQDCSTCHELVAVEEQDPKILKDLGVK